MKQSQARETPGTPLDGCTRREARASHRRPARSPAAGLGPQGATASACQPAGEGRGGAFAARRVLSSRERRCALTLRDAVGRKEGRNARGRRPSGRRKGAVDFGISFFRRLLGTFHSLPRSHILMVRGIDDQLRYGGEGELSIFGGGECQGRLQPTSNPLDVVHVQLGHLLVVALGSECALFESRLDHQHRISEGARLRLDLQRILVCSQRKHLWREHGERGRNRWGGSESRNKLVSKGALADAPGWDTRTGNSSGWKLCGVWGLRMKCHQPRPSPPESMSSYGTLL